MQWTLEQEGEQGARLRLGGQLSVECGGELHQALQQAVTTTGAITIEIAEDTVMDLAALQLLCAAHKGLTGDGRRMAIAKPVPDSFKRLVAAAGLLRQHGCQAQPGESCFWLGENLA